MDFNTNEFERRVINNGFLLLAIDKMLEKSKTTRDEHERYCVSKNICIGIITDIKVSPYYFNKTGKYLIYMFLDREKNIVLPIKDKTTGAIKKLNIEKNILKWG
jgi:predicted peptidase